MKEKSLGMIFTVVVSGSQKSTFRPFVRTEFSTGVETLISWLFGYLGLRNRV